MNKYFLAGYCLLLCFYSLKAQNDLLNQFGNIKIENEEQLNSPELEYSPCISRAGTIIFISDQPVPNNEGLLDKKIQKQTMNIYQATKMETGKLGTPKPFAEELTTKWHEGPVSFNHAGTQIYFSRNSASDQQVEKNYKGIIKQRILMADLKDNQWVNIRTLPFNNKEFDFIHPSIDTANRVLYFSSDQPGGYGGMDIWKVIRVGGQWTTPMNLGPTINTSYDEVFPVIHPSDHLFFASDRPSGFGRKDIYGAKLVNRKFGKAVNLGGAINSVSDDFGLVLDSERQLGYFSSNKEGGKGQDDIYRFTFLKKPSTTFEWTVLNAATGEGVEKVKVIVTPNKEEWDAILTDDSGAINVEIPSGDYSLLFEKEGYLPQQINLSSPAFNNKQTISLERDPNCKLVQGIVVNEEGQSVATAVVRITNKNGITTIFTDEKGRFEKCLACNQRYDFQARQAEKTGFQSLDIDATCTKDPIDLRIQLNTIPEPIVIRLKRLFYDFNAIQFRQNARQELDNIARLLQKDPYMEIEVASHTDVRGSESYNLQLSQKRADKVVQYLQNKGIAGNRIRAIGYGSKRLINECQTKVVCSELGHQYNRRTEIHVLNYSNKQLVFEAIDNPPERIDPAPKWQKTANKYYVIAGSFNESKNASKRLNALKEIGFERAKLLKTSGKVRNLVVVDTFLNRQQANELAAAIEHDFSISTYVKRKIGVE